jgi:pimeloyl-ACP methyl ester carboxylesterase
MATYVLIHGAGSDSWYWHLVVPKLRALGHDVVAPDLPVADDSAGLAEYTDTVVDAIGDRTDVILVAQSMAGFTAPMVSERVPVDLIVMLAAMVPAPGESPGDWWTNTGHSQAKRAQDERDGRDPDADFDPFVTFLHDLPPDVLEAAMTQGVPPGQSDTPFEKPWPLDKWPDVPTRFLLCRQDRFFPADFLRRIVPERLGITPDEMDSGHLPALAHPTELVERLEAYRTSL